MQLITIVAIRIDAVGSISGAVAVIAVKRVLAEAASCGMALEAEMLAAEPGIATESALLPHAAGMRAAGKARMSAAEAAAAEAAVATTAVRVGRADGERRGKRCCCQNHDGSFHGKLLLC